MNLYDFLSLSFEKLIVTLRLELGRESKKRVLQYLRAGDLLCLLDTCRPLSLPDSLRLSLSQSRSRLCLLRPLYEGDSLPEDTDELRLLPSLLLLLDLWLLECFLLKGVRDLAIQLGLHMSVHMLLLRWLSIRDQIASWAKKLCRTTSRMRLEKKPHDSQSSETIVLMRYHGRTPYCLISSFGVSLNLMPG